MDAHVSGRTVFDWDKTDDCRGKWTHSVFVCFNMKTRPIYPPASKSTGHCSGAETASTSGDSWRQGKSTLMWIRKFLTEKRNSSAFVTNKV